MNESIYGWDIGGAHLKVAQLAGDGSVVAVRQVACPLWHGIGELARACAALKLPIDAHGAIHAVTMTGELCDIFPDRASGVQAIIAEFLKHVGTASRVQIFGGYAGWLSPEVACGEAATAVASANWLALAAYIAEVVGDGLLVDIGSTTTDVIPISAGLVQSVGRDDASRLASEELVYTGVVRTPVVSVCSSVPYRGHRQPLVGEVFATMADVYRLLNLISEHHDLMPAADGAGKDRRASARRLARMLGVDLDSSDAAEMDSVAAYLARRQRQRIEEAIALVLSRDASSSSGETLIGAGAGRFVVEDIARIHGLRYRSFDALLGVDTSVADYVAIAAPAVAAAKLAWMRA
jgi:probable H4MPT-linked C1 transfer pathway protein